MQIGLGDKKRLTTKKVQVRRESSKKRWHWVLAMESA